MLEDLRRVPWDQLHHAYGSAEDVPGMIKGLLSYDPIKRSEIWWDLYGTLYHQGTVYSATEAAIPFFIELLGSEEVRGKDEILSFLARVSTNQYYFDLIPREFSTGPERLIERKAIMEEDAKWGKRCSDAVSGGISVFLTFLEQGSLAERQAAAFIVSCCESVSPMVWKKLIQIVQDEPDPQTRATLLIGLGRLCPDTVGDLDVLLEGDWSNPLDQVAIAIAAIRGHAESIHKVPTKAIEILFDAFQKPKLLSYNYAQLPWALQQHEGDFIGDILRLLTLLPFNVTTSNNFELLLDAFKKMDASELGGVHAMEALLFIVFRGERPPQGVSFEALDHTQQRVLRVLATGDNYLGNMGNILSNLGFPGMISALRRYVGVSIADLATNALEIGRLALHKRDLREIPPEIFKFRNLQDLNLNDNQISTVPPEIGTLESLLYLRLQNNNLVHLPNEICSLTRLEVFDLSGNDLDELPPCLFDHCTRFTFLWLGNNNLQEIPSNIGNLSRLQSLDLSGNEIENLPKELGTLPCLEYLYTNALPLRDLGQEIDNIVDLPKLRYLSIGGSRIEDASKHLAKLQYLTDLCIRGSEFKDPSLLLENLSHLSGLRTLNLDDCNLQALSPHIQKFTGLTELRLPNNHLSELPRELLFLSKLRSLHLDGNGFTTLPGWISEFSNLRFITLRQNPISPPVVEKLETMLNGKIQILVNDP